jgi:leader peptidase (prepilin peptidase)/N-methyltransferase
MPIALMLFPATAGLVLGSFLNVVVHRLPRGESLVAPRSRCPGCATPIRARDNVPVLSWFALRGCCRSCGEPIAARYPLVEGLTAALYVAVVLAGGIDGNVWLGLAFVTMLVPVALIDLERRIIPNKILAPAAVVAVVLLAVFDAGALPEHLIAGAAAGSFFLLAALAHPRGMGMGDVKLAAVMGLYLGRAVAPAVLAALVLGIVVGAVIIGRRGIAGARKTGVPFGPFLALGGLVAIFAGGPLVDWYLNTVV